MKYIDASAWTARSQEAVSLAQGRTVAVWQTYARDADRLARLQGSLILLLALWALWSVSQLLWMPFRGGEIETAPSMALNPPALRSPRESAIIDVSAVLGSGLFGGEPDTLAPEAGVASGIESDRKGIEHTDRYRTIWFLRNRSSRMIMHRDNIWCMYDVKILRISTML